MQTLWQDLKFAVRMLRKNPGFAAVAMLTLALGIGANTAIFSVVNAVLLRPLPYTESNRLLAISQTDRASGTTGVPVSFTKFTEISEQNKSLASVAAFYPYTPSLVSEHEPELVNGMRISEDFFRVLGIAPLLGRSFLPEEETLGGNNVVI
jgi:putative ABC transport system permease protein